jgi:hypothetical protein
MPLREDWRETNGSEIGREIVYFRANRRHLVRQLRQYGQGPHRARREWWGQRRARLLPVRAR